MNKKNVTGILSREEMKSVIGGCSATATCGAKCSGVGDCVASSQIASCKQKNGTYTTVTCPSNVA